MPCPWRGRDEAPSQPQDPAEAGDRQRLYHIRAGGVGDIQPVVEDTRQLPLWILERVVIFPTETKITRDHSRAIDLDTVPALLYAATDLIQETEEKELLAEEGHYK